MAKARDYFSLVKFSHTIFAMPFALIGFFLGFMSIPTSVVPGWHTRIYTESQINAVVIKLILVVLCMVFARTSAMAFNRYLDHDIDSKNPRTAIREIPAGKISRKNALILTIISSLLFILCAYLINNLCFFLAPVALLVILGYSYTKRFTALCHLILGLALSLAPIGAYIALMNEFHLLPILFSLAVLFWVSGFDIIYSLQDEEFDRANKLHSIPAAVGKKIALRISELLHLFSTSCIVLAGYKGGFGIIYWVGALIFVGMLVYQHTIVKPDDLRRVNVAFMTVNGIASVVFSIFVITDLFIHG